MACLSLRTGFDLLLSALHLPAGSEVLMSAVTVADMVRIVEHHGLKAMPIDLDMRTLAPQVEKIEAALTPKSRVIVVAHLFGSRVPLEPILEIARRHDLFVIEDLAQGFAGPDDLSDHSSDAVLFSFGTIKTATALGGALVRVREPQVLQRMRRIAAKYPLQSRAAYLSRVLKCAALKAATAWPCYTALIALLGAAGFDHDRLAAKLVRGFPAARLFERLRRRPSGPLLGMLDRRLAQFDAERLQRRGERGRGLAARLDGRFTLPGAAAERHSHWIFPVLAREPKRLIAALHRAGFHATQGRSMCTVAAPAGRPDLQPRCAERLLREGVFLPVYSELPERELERLVSILLEFAADPGREPAPAGEVATTIAPRPW